MLRGIFTCAIFFTAVAMPIGEEVRNQTLQVNEHSVSTSALTQSLNILYISDIHIANSTSLSDLDNIISVANSYQPDVVLLGGDYIDAKDQKIKKADLDIIADKLGGLKAKYGVFSVNGDHDWQFELNNGRNDGSSYIAEAMNRHNIQTLENETVKIRANEGDEFCVTGVSFAYKPGYKSKLDDIEPALIPNCPTVLFTHVPTELLRISSDLTARHSFLYAVAGETHCGQIPFIGPWYLENRSHIPKNLHGGPFKLASGIEGYVSCGVGTSHVPVRAQNPQIEALHFKPYKAFVSLQ